MSTVTRSIYNILDQAFDFFNTELFDAQLEMVAITLQHSRRGYGYFHKASFQSRQGAAASEIAMNPDTFLGRTDKDILGTLLHEMTHHWQHTFGHPSRTSYHNKEFARKMQSLGLITSDTGKEGGKSTGQNMSHYVQPGGPFDRVCDQFTHEAINWGSPRPEYSDEQPIDTAGLDTRSANSRLTSKTKFSCPNCKQNAWAKPSARLICADCKMQMKA